MHILAILKTNHAFFSTKNNIPWFQVSKRLCTTIYGRVEWTPTSPEPFFCSDFVSQLWRNLVQTSEMKSEMKRVSWRPTTGLSTLPHRHLLSCPNFVCLPVKNSLVNFLNVHSYHVARTTNELRELIIMKQFSYSSKTFLSHIEWMC